jgi:hypothetical protein
MTNVPPPRLPVYARPTDGDSIDSYIRRLAQANHLPPGDLRSHLCAAGSAGPPLIEKLAAVTGRPLAALQRALTDTRCGICYQPLVRVLVEVLSQVQINVLSSQATSVSRSMAARRFFSR